MKKVLSVLSLAAFCLAMVCLLVQPAQAADWHEDYSAFNKPTYTSGLYTYALERGEAIVTDVDTSVSGHVIVPSELDGYPVTFLYGMSFAYCNEVTEVTVPDSVRTIGFNCFRECKKLTTVNIGENVTTFIGQTFYKCPAFTTVNWGPKVTKIGRRTFEGCDALTSVTIPDTVTTVGEYLFAYCDNLTSVTLSENLTDLPQAVFTDCPNLKTLVIPDSVQNIGKMCFEGCTGLESVVLGKGVKTIGMYAFAECKNLTNVAMNDCVESIGEYAFKQCQSLLSIVIPDTTTSIGNEAFKDCKSLTSVTLSKNLQVINTSVFYGCSSLDNVVIPDSVTEIGNHAFFACTSMKNLTIGPNVQKIDTFAFQSCGIESVVIPDSVTFMGREAFSRCSDLKTLVIGKGITELPEQAFYYCTSLESATIGENVTTIGREAFVNCASMQEFIVAEDNPNYSTDSRGVLFNKEQTVLIQAPGGIQGEYVMPDTVIEINEYAFYESEKLTRVIFADGVKKVGNFAFIRCTALNYVDYGESLESVGSFCFGYCTSLTSIDLPNTLKEIAPLMYDGCNGLIHVTLPDSIEVIGREAFAYCINLETIDLGASVTLIKNSAFIHCTNLKSFSLGDKLTQVEDMAFYRCDRLTDVYFDGTAEQWYLVDIYSDPINNYNGCLISAYVHCIREHEHEFSKYVNDNNATCMEDGTESAQCKICGLVISRPIPGSAGGHSGGEATCLAPAVCIHCGQAYGDTDPFNHGETEVQGVVEASCTQQGYSGDLYCLDCGNIAVHGEVLDYAHTYETTVVTGSYTKPGYAEHTCTNCGYSYQDDFVPADGLPKPEITVTEDGLTGGSTLLWIHDGEADRYEIYRATSYNGKYSLYKTVTEPVADVMLAVNQTYYFKVKAICDADNSLNSGYSNYVKIVGKCAQPTAVVANDAKGYPLVKWDKVTGAKKYEVWYATAENGTYKKLTTVSSNSYTYTKAQMNVQYFFKIRAYGSSTASTGSFSAVASGWRKLVQPAITVTANYDASSATITWQKLTGALSYELQCSIDGGEYATVDVITGTTYTHTDLNVGSTYTYRLRALCSSAEATSDFSPVKSVSVKCGKPVLTITATDEGNIVLSWNAVKGAASYEIQVATSARGKYTTLAVLEGTTEYIHAEAVANKTYYYKLRAIDGNGTAGDFCAYKSAMRKCEVPVNTAVANDSKGYPLVKWEKVNGAKKYEVWYATAENGTYKKLATVSSNSYTYTKAQMNVQYFFKVRAYGSSTASTGNFSAAASGWRKLVQPAITVTANHDASSATITWKKLTGALGYELQCSIDGGEYETVTVVTGTTYTHTDLNVGSTYTYRLRGLGSSAEATSDFSPVKSVAIKCGKPVLSFSYTENGKIILSWNAVKGAASYEIQVATSARGKYTTLAVLEGTTEYIHAEAVANKTYYYKLRAIDGSGTAGDFCAYKSAVCKCEAPVITEVTVNSSGYPMIKWDKVTGAKKYEVWVSTAEDGIYTKLATVSANSYSHTKAKMDVQYFYKIRAYGSSTTSAGNLSAVASGWRKLATPSISLSVNQSGRKATISWRKISGAVGYELQCSVNGGEFVTIATGTKLSFVHENLAAGNSYTYRVRALSNKAEGISNYSAVKTGIIKVAKPDVAIALSEDGKPQLTWESVEGAVKYEIYYATSKSGKYKLVETTEELNYIYAAAVAGKTCYFKVRAIDANGNAGDYSTVKYIKSK